MRLLQEGGAVTVDRVAEAADVSRRTVYMHFPTLDQLVLDAALGALSAVETGPGAPVEDPADPSAPAAAGSRTPAQRLDELVRRVLGQAEQTLPLGRQLLRLTVADPRTDQPGRPLRGYRRVQWIEQALEQLRPEVDDEQFDRLVSALAVLIGFESMIVMRDIRGADATTETRVLTWAARALLEAMQAEARPLPGQPEPPEDPSHRR